MPSNSVRWIVSIVLGLLIGKASYGVLLPVLLALVPGQPASAAGSGALSGSDTLMYIGTVIWLLITVVASIALARIPNMRRLIGWGCVVLGIALMLTIPATMLTMDFDANKTATAGAQAANDANTALLFWALIFGLPYVGGGLVLTILGAVLIRKNPGVQAPVAAS